MRNRGASGAGRRPDYQYAAGAANRPHRDGHALSRSGRQAAGGFGGRGRAAHLPAPVFIIGPETVDGSYRNFATRTVLCAVSFHTSSRQVATFAAQVAAEQKASLVLQHVIPPQERHQALAGRSIDELEAELANLVPAELQDKTTMQTIVVPGDPTEELLYQCKAQQADLIVLGAQGASAFAAAARQGVVYKVAAHAHCPVLTLSPVVLASSSVKTEKAHPVEAYLGGVF